MDMTNAAMEYCQQGYSVIPVGKNKTPLESWKDRQDQPADIRQVERSFRNASACGIGIVTGKISGLSVVDIDSEESYQKLQKTHLPESLVTPIAKSPHGHHIYFQHMPGLNTVSGVLDHVGIPGVDIRTDGGYIIAPPSDTTHLNNSQQKGGKYKWLPGLELGRVTPAPMPSSLYNAVISIKGLRPEEDNHASQTSQKVTSVAIGFTKGLRNQTCFRVADCSIRGGMKIEEAKPVVHFLASNCTPPLPRNEVEKILESASNRSAQRLQGVTSTLREFFQVTNGQFHITDAAQYVANVTNIPWKDVQPTVRKTLHRFAKAGQLETDAKRDGLYRVVNNTADKIDFLKADDKPVSLWLPLGLNDLVNIYPGNIILIAGVSNAGKTLFALNTSYYNMNHFEVHYFSSEMGAQEFARRVDMFPAGRSGWCINAYERSENFADVIKPGNGNLNIIDYLEINEDFYLIRKMLADIHHKLKGALAVVCVQKNRGTDIAVGGHGSLDKPRLYLSIDFEKATIVKAKNRKRHDFDPNGKQVNFKIDGHQIIKRGKWHTKQEP